MKTKLTPENRISMIAAITSGLLAGGVYPCGAPAPNPESWRRTRHAVIDDAADILDEIVALVDEDESAHTPTKETN